MSLQDSDAECAVAARAPRVSLADMEAKIDCKHEFTMGAALAALQHPTAPHLYTMSVCVLVMRNGFTIVGKAAPAHPANFDPQLGRRLAYEDAINQLWPHEGYALRERLAAQNDAKCGQGAMAVSAQSTGDNRIHR